MRVHLTVASLAILLLAACARSGGPAPVEYRGVGAGETAPTMATLTAPPPEASPVISRESVSSVPLEEPQDAYAQAASRTAPPAAGTLTPAPVQQEQVLASTTLPPATAAAPAPAATPASTSIPYATGQMLGSGEFGWPLRGKLLSGFGPKAGGQANDGLNIAAPLGSAVYASKDGTVAYAGNELRSFGNMVLVRHTGGMFTVYAHLDQINVSKDQAVTKGQPVGTVGQSGGVSEPQLHFEVRRGSTPLDPKKYLGR